MPPGAATPVPTYRGSGADRPGEVPLPPAKMPLFRGGRVLKQWRYVGVYGPELSLCIGLVRVGFLRQSFWAVWDRSASRLHERTALHSAGVQLAPGSVEVRARGVEIDLRLEEGPGVEVVTPYGSGYVWTRKQAGIRAHGSVIIGPDRHELDGRAFIDDWAGYPRRHTSWLWSAGLGTDLAGRSIAWNLVTGINDGARDSERTLWIDGRPQEVEPVRFASDLSSISFAEGSTLRFTPEAVRRRRENLLLIRSSYEQPFGRFSGQLPGGVELDEQSYGVMERHDAVW